MATPIMGDLTMPGEDQAQMPRYKCHKEVWALKLTRALLSTDGSYIVYPESGFAPLQTTPKYPFKGTDADPGYYVRYQDGYESWSPTKAFEEGYTLLR